MKSTVYLYYYKCSFEERFIIWRFIQEVFIQMPGSFEMEERSKTPQRSLVFELSFNYLDYPSHRDYILFMVRKWRELKEILNCTPRLKIKNEPAQKMTVEFINKTVCLYFNVLEEVFQSETRKREIVQARQVAMSLSRSLTKESSTDIGFKTGGKDHATCLYAIKTINNLKETDKKFRAQVNEIEERLKRFA